MAYSHTRRTVLAGAALLGVGGAALPVAAAAAGASARVAGERRVDERLVELTVDSPALGGSSAVALLTPRGWDSRGPGDRWPTLYLLAGGDGDHTAWTTMFRVQELAELRDVLVVMPGCRCSGSGPIGGTTARAASHGCARTSSARLCR